MNFNEVEPYLSTARIYRYLHICGSQTRAIKLYKANMKLAQAFHPLLGALEVIVRNSINNALAAHFTDVNWIMNQRTGFMSSPTLRGTRFFLREQVTKTERDLTRRSLAITSGRIIAEQNFGFWTDLFEPHHFRLIAASPMKAFSNLPRGYSRAKVASELTQIRKFRNRINHNEPIILYRHAIDFTYPSLIHQSITNVFDWVNPKINSWVKELDKVPQVLSRCQKL